MGEDKMRVLIGNFIKIFDIKYINKFIHMPEYLPALSTTIYLTHIFQAESTHVHIEVSSYLRP